MRHLPAMCSVLHRPGLLCVAAGLAVSAQLLAAGPAAAQPAAPLPAESRSSPPARDQRPVPPVDPVHLFVDACLLTQGVPAEVVDRGVLAGLFPTPKDTPQVAPLLDGQPGAVLSVAGEGEPPATLVLLAVVPGEHCTVWTEGLHGPSVYAGLMRMAQALRQQDGVSAQVVSERTVERAGAWRRQLQWHFRLAPELQQFRFSTLTTLGEAPGVQVLRMTLTPARADPSAGASSAVGGR